MDSTILAIDLGKFNSVFCWYNPDTKEAVYDKVQSRPGLFAEKIQSRPVSRVVIEAGALCGWVYDLCQSLNLSCDVANTNAEAWLWKNVKRKTDRDDALKLARLSSHGELPLVQLPPRPVRQWKSLIGLRKRFVGERVRVQNRIRAVLVMQGLPAPIGKKAWTELGRAGIAVEARPLADCKLDELWRGELTVLLQHYDHLVTTIDEIEKRLDREAESNAAVIRLQTIPGVGPRTAEVVVTHLHDPNRFTTADEVGSYSGLVPKQYQSGETDRRGRITKRGPRLLRSLLVEAAWRCVRCNKVAKDYWQRLRQRGVSGKKAIVALGRKLLVWCWAMLRHQQDWQPGSKGTVAAGPLSG
jgi:transposase